MRHIDQVESCANEFFLQRHLINPAFINPAFSFICSW